MSTTQKIIKIGSSRGVTLPARDLKRLGVEIGDEVDIIVKKRSSTGGGEALSVASALLARYDDDFKNLAGR